MKQQLQHLALATAALWLCGCASTTIKNTWKAPDFPGDPVQKVSVVAVDDHKLVREGIENRFVRELREHGQAAVPTYDLLALSEIKADKQAAAARVRAAGADGILVIRLVDQATYALQMRTTPELYAPVSTGFGSYGWNDYCTVAFVDMGPVWSSSVQDLFIDSNLFDLKTGKRLWTALTRTVLKEDADRLPVADELAAKVVSTMRKAGVVR